MSNLFISFIKADSITNFFYQTRSSVESATEIPDTIEAEAERQATLHQRRESVLESFEKNQVTNQLKCYKITSGQGFKLKLQVDKITTD
jgi:hypothetical protein